ncbi:outer membrane beta-barrel protein [Kaarinaea lacus]
MRKPVRALTCLLLLLITTSTFAAGLTFGAKTGPMQVDISGVDDPLNAGVNIGYEFGIGLGDLGFEGEFTTTTKEGELGLQKFNIDTGSVYLTYRTPGFVYLKGRAGYLGWDADFNVNGKDDGNSASYGLGLGFNLKVIKIEMEYTQIEENIDFISLGILF